MMSSTTAPSSSYAQLGGPSKPGRHLGPSLDKIIKNAAWRKHSHLIQSCKSALDKLQTLSSSSPSEFPNSPIPGFPASDADLVLSPLLLALDTGNPKLIEPALDCLCRLASSSLLYCSADRIDEQNSTILLLSAAAKCASTIDDDVIELAVIKFLLSTVRSGSMRLHGDVLAHVLKTLYNVYLGSVKTENRICAKAALAQIVLIIIARAEADKVEVKVPAIAAMKLLEVADRNLNESGLVQFVQGFVEEVLDAWEPVTEVVRQEKEEEEVKGDAESKMREDAFFLMKTLCKFSMKFSTQDNPEDELLIKGKVLSLELLKILMDHVGPNLRANERFVGVTKQFLCLSLVKNSALSIMSVFQILCSIFVSLLSTVRSSLKAEIGIFFPMLVLRVLENVLQPIFLQKMTVLNLLEKICEDPQTVVDIFVNYDCDVELPNIFERIVNGLLKTALGVPAGASSSLSPAQDIAFRHESIRCLVAIVKSMGVWMDQQYSISDSRPLDRHESDNINSENLVSSNSEDALSLDYELHSETFSESPEAVTLEQRRAYKMELQKGIALFNRKPSKGIDFLINTKKIGNTPEAVASFLKSTSGLNATVIGDYLGERDEFALKVMHAYVDAMSFEKISFGDAIRFFLQGFRLPGEAQKIDRIMEKFAERYCKCNPDSFRSADTAYVLAYSVIMLNTDAHNKMVKDKMSKADFIRNNRGINNGEDLPEDYLGSLYDDIVKNEIKIGESSTSQNKQVNGINKLLGIDNILNLVMWKQPEEKPLGTSDGALRDILEQFKAKSNKTESVYYTVADAAILRFMMEACWAPMLAAFSVNLDQSDEKVIAIQCLQGFRHAIHVTSVMSLQTQRDAFVTSVAKFTYLHCAADMKQKNVEAVKAIISIAIEDGNYLQEAWEHILTCLSRFENLQLLGEGAPPDSQFLAVPQAENEEKTSKSPANPLLRKKGASIQHPAVMAVLRGGAYDSTTSGINTSAPVTVEQINHLISNLHMLDQIGSFELNHIYVHSQRLNSEAIVGFVKALCKVSMTELQSPTDPRVFSLTKIVEIAHYNMNRIRLVWSRIWHVLSDFFVSVGLSENLSVSIFVMDSLRQLSMKFLEREELANYSFQSEFLKPFVIVMQKSNSAEIRELIVRCVSQMVLVRVSNIKSGWKSVFLVFTTAASDERKNIVVLAFETIEKIVRDYFPYMIETEKTIFTDCVKCLITFTTSKSNSDVSLNAIAFLRCCAVKLAEGGMICYDKVTDFGSLPGSFGDVRNGFSGNDKDDPIFYWVPLLMGLSELTHDLRDDIRKSSLEVLFNILRDHGHLFSFPFWVRVYRSIIFPIFSSIQDLRSSNLVGRYLQDLDSEDQVDNVWTSETCALAAQYLVDLFIGFFDVVRSQLPNIVIIVTNFIKVPNYASIGVSALMRLTNNVGNKFSESEWEDILLSLRKATASTIPTFSLVATTMDGIEVPDNVPGFPEGEFHSEHEHASEEPEDDSLQVASYCVARMKAHISVLLLIIQVVTELYKVNGRYLSTSNMKILLDILATVSQHAHEMNSDSVLQEKLHGVCLILEIPDPPVLHLESEAYLSYLKFLESLINDNKSLADGSVESQLIGACKDVLKIYIYCADCQSQQQLPDNISKLSWIVPLGTARKEELAARTNLAVSTLHVLLNLERSLFKRNVSQIFPLLVNLIRCEHSSTEVQRVLRDLFHFCIGPLLLRL